MKTEQPGIIIPTRQEVTDLLFSFCDQEENRSWVKHSFCVGDTAARIATAINKAAINNATTDQSTVNNTTNPNHSSSPTITKPSNAPAGPLLNPAQLVLLGYLHDIGRSVYLTGPLGLHLRAGYDLLRARGYAPEYCAICLTHSFIGPNPHSNLCSALDPERDAFVIDFVSRHPYSLAEDLISLCDLMCKTRVVSIDERIADATSRHGTCPATASHIEKTYQLKAKFDALLGYDLYDLFPEISS